jgi:hypothetical protein
LTYRLPLALCLALLFVWSLPGTIALRSLLLFVTAALLALSTSREEWRSVFREGRLPVLVFAALTVWFCIQAPLLATDPGRVFGELKGQWLPAAIALLTGLALGLALLRERQHAVLLATTGIVAVFGAQAAIAVLQSLWHWHQQGQLLMQQVPLTGGKLEMSFVLNLLLAFITVDLFCRVTGRPAIIAFPLGVVSAILAITLASAYLAGARNGIVAIVFLSISAASLFVFDQRHRLGAVRALAAAALILLTVTIFGYASYSADARWQDFRETAGLALKVQPGQFPELGTPAWPMLTNGRPAEPSAFTRVAFIHMGLELLGDAPLGHGYGRNAFGHALREIHGSGRGHAHSGWIDLGVGGGIPALALWGAFLASLMWLGWQAFSHRGNAHGLLLFLLAAGFAGRMALDSVNKDHMLQMFLFLAGVLLVLTAPPRAEKAP